MQSRRYWPFLLILVAVMAFGLWRWSGTFSDSAGREGAIALHSGQADNGTDEAVIRSGSLLTAPRAKHGARRERKPVLARLLNSPNPYSNINKDAVDRYVTAEHESARSLLAALMATGDTNYLQRAAALHPDDPLVQFQMLSRDIDPDQRAQWLAAFQASSPDNAMPDYLAARDAFKANDSEQALAALASAMEKPGYNDFSREISESMESMFLSGGNSPAEAKALSMALILMPQLGQFKDMSQSLAALQTQYQQAGDWESAGTISILGLDFARQLSERSGSQVLVDQLVGVAMEGILLKQMDPHVAELALQGSVADRQQELANFKQEIRNLSTAENYLMTSTDAQEVSTFYDMVRQQGELTALKWLQRRHPQ